MPVLCIDMGSDATRVLKHGHGVVYDFPTLLKTDTVTGSVIECAVSEKSEVNRLPYSVTLSAPVRNGKIEDFTDFEKLITAVTDKILGRNILKPEIRFAYPADTGELEILALKDALARSGAARTVVLNEGYCAAMGAGASFSGRDCFVVVNVGASKTVFCVLSYGDTVLCETIPIAGNSLNEAIISYASEIKNTVIAADEAERIKLLLCSAVPRKDLMALTINGKDKETGLPKLSEISSDELYPVTAGVLGILAGRIKNCFEKLSPELCGDMTTRSIVLTGGSANLPGIAEFLTRELSVDCIAASEPAYCVVKGLDRSLKNGRINTH